MTKYLCFKSMLVGVLLFSAGCDITSVRDAVDDFDLIIQLEPIETYLIVEVVDAGSGELIDGAVELSFDGNDASSIIDFYSDPIRSLDVRGGIATVGLQQGVVPQNTNPVQFRVTAAGAGYEDGLANVRIEAEGEHTLSIPLVASGMPLEGSGRAGAETWLTAGRTSSFSLTTSASAEVAAAEASVPSGSRLQSASGKELAGTLTVNLVHFDATHASVLAAFPGGFDGMTVDSDVSSADAAIMAAGFTNFSARSSEGDDAVEFSNDVSRTVGISPGAINPRTGMAYRAGDEVSVMWFNRSDGTWAHETDATIVEGFGKSSSPLSVTYPSRRTGYQAIGGVVETCPSGITFDVDRNGHDGALRGTITGPEGSGYRRSIEIPADARQITVRDLPKDVSLELNVDLPGRRSATHSFVSACGGSETVRLPAAAASSVDVNFSVDLSCTLRLQPPFNATLKYKLAGTPGGGVSAGIPEWTTDNQGRVDGGSLTIPGMYLDETYRFILITPDETAWEDVTISGPEMHFDVDVPRDLCRR